MLIAIHLLRIELYDTAEGEGGLSPGDVSGDHTAGQQGQQICPRAALAEKRWQSCLWKNRCPHPGLKV